MIVVLIVLCILVAVAVAALIRNERVYNYRVRLLDLISDAHRAEINAGIRYNGWRYREFGSVNYHRMVLQFWKPFPSFYRNTSIANEAHQAQEESP